MNKRAFDIYRNVVNAMQDADEIEGVEGDDYLELMQAIQDEASNRFNVCLDNMVFREAQRDEALNNSQ